MEAHGYTAIESLYDKVKTNLFMETERPHAVRQAIMCCRKGGTRLDSRGLRRFLPISFRWAPS